MILTLEAPQVYFDSLIFMMDVMVLFQRDIECQYPTS